jgi:hypothetical protein
LEFGDAIALRAPRLVGTVRSSLENGETENESAGLDTKDFCSFYVPRETLPAQAIET